MKSLGGNKLLPFKNDGGHCVLGDLQCFINVLVPFPRSVPRHNPVSEPYGQNPFPELFILLGFCSDMYCQLWDLYIDRCVPFQIMSNQWKQEAPEHNLESHSKGSEYFCKVNLFICKNI